MTSPTGEMPFLDHLEELRRRILLALAGAVIGVGLGWVLTPHFHLAHVIQGPGTKYVPNGQLMVTELAQPFLINMKLAIVLGLLLASPWVLFQVWLFLSPALTGKEK